MGDLVIKPRKVKRCLCPECGAELYNAVSSVTISNIGLVARNRDMELEGWVELLCPHCSAIFRTQWDMEARGFILD